MMHYSFWVHKGSGDVFAVLQEDRRVIRASDAIDYQDLLAYLPQDFAMDNDGDWFNENTDKFDLWERPADADDIEEQLEAEAQAARDRDNDVTGYYSSPYTDEELENMSRMEAAEFYGHSGRRAEDY